MDGYGKRETVTDIEMEGLREKNEEKFKMKEAEEQERHKTEKEEPGCHLSAPGATCNCSS